MINRVEGTPGPVSCEIKRGVPEWSSNPIPHGASPDLKVLATVLRGKAKLPDEIRQWLADLMDPDGSSKFQFKKLSKRRQGAKSERSSTPDTLEVGNFISDEIHRGVKRKNAIADAVKKFGVSKATIEAKLAEWNEAMEAIWDVNREVEAERVLEETRKLHMDKESK